MKIVRSFLLMKQLLQRDRGLALNAESGAQVTTGFAVGLGRAGAVAVTIPASASNAEIEAALIEVIVRNASTLVRGGSVCLGGWNDGEKIVLEPSEVIADLSDALLRGATLGEEAVYALPERRTIYVAAADRVRAEMARAASDPLHPWHEEEVLP